VPVAKLVKAEPPRRWRHPPESWRGQIWIAPDAFSPEVDAEIARDFEESELWPAD